MIRDLSATNSIVNHFLFELRDKDIQKDRGKFRNNLKRLGWILAYEMSKTLRFLPHQYETPLDKATTPLPADFPVIIVVLRAALPLMQGVVDVFDQADVGFVGAFRKKDVKEVEIHLGYAATPDLNNRDVLLVDTMLATGKSFIKTIDQLAGNGTPRHYHFLSAVAAPEGIDYISSHLKNKQYTIWVGAVDDRLDSKSYIVPGLGDAGDLSYGHKI